VAVTGITDAVAIYAGDHHSCALIADGTARCWGNNSVGQLGNGTATHSYVPVAVTGMSDAAAITAGGAHSCAVLADGTARCWGNNSVGQLGDGSAWSTVPVPVIGLS
jgi:alpha-tubulin suppressor-like RCC1 family protein